MAETIWGSDEIFRARQRGRSASGRDSLAGAAGSESARVAVESLSQLHSSLRVRGVFCTSTDGLVIPLGNGSSVEDAMRSLHRLRRERGLAAIDGSPRREGVRLVRAFVNGRSVRRSYVIRNGDVLSTPERATWDTRRTRRPSERQRDSGSIDEGTAGEDAQYSQNTQYWAARVPWPWSLIQSDELSDRRAWNVEAERKHGNVAVTAASTWLWLLALGWVTPDTAPLAGLSGLSGVCWAMQFGTFGLFEARSLLRNTLGGHGKSARRGQEGDAPAAARPRLGPHLGPFEPPLWLGRFAMVLVTALALRTDFVQQGGVLHSFVDPPRTILVEQVVAEREAAEAAADSADGAEDDVVGRERSLDAGGG